MTHYTYFVWIDKSAIKIELRDSHGDEAISA